MKLGRLKRSLSKFTTDDKYFFALSSGFNQHKVHLDRQQDKFIQMLLNRRHRYRL